MRNDRKLVVAMIVLWGLAGLVEPHLPGAGEAINAVAVVQTVVFAFLAFAWCKEHAKAMGIKPPTAAPFLMGVLTIVGFPYYSFRAYGFVAGLKLLAQGILLMVLLLAVYILCFLGSQQFVT